METIWKEVKGFEGLYEVSNTGLVRSMDREIIGKNGVKQHFKSRELKGSPLKAGHLQVQLRKDGNRTVKLVHRLVAEAFFENFTENCIIDHIDGCPSNNNITNLRITNQTGNLRYRDENWDKIIKIINEKIRQYGYDIVIDKIASL